MAHRISDEELRSILSEATQGPWRVEVSHGACMADEVLSGDICVVSADSYDAPLIALSPALAAEVLQLREALETIANIKERRESKYPADWHEQIAACPECQRYKGHPIQQGICDTHRKPIYAQQDHDAHETKILGYRAMEIARAALSADAMKREQSNG